MKKWISILLIAFMIGSIFTVVPNAEGLEHSDYLSVDPFEQKKRAKEDYIYYSDLFYGYPTFLVNNDYFSQYKNDTNNLFDTVYEQYTNDPAIVGTALEHSMDSVASPSELVAFVTDTLGISSFDKDKAFDSANKKLILSLVDGTYNSNLLIKYGKTGKIINNLKESLNTLKSVVETNPHKFYRDNRGKYYRIMDGDIVTIKDGDIFSIGDDNIYIFKNDRIGIQESDGEISFLDDAEIVTLEEFTKYLICEEYKQCNSLLENLDGSFAQNLVKQLENSMIQITELFDTLDDGIKITEAFITAIVIANASKGIVDNIVASQTEDNILKYGMTRLKNQLSGGAVTYFMDTYVRTGAIKEFGKIFNNAVTYAIPGYGEISIAIKEIKEIIFSIWSVPKYDDVMTFKILQAYSYYLNLYLTNKPNTFTGGPFFSNKIFEYESIFQMYVKANELAVNELKNIANSVSPYGEIYEYLLDAERNGSTDFSIEFTMPGSGDVKTIAIPYLGTEQALIEKLSEITFDVNSFSITSLDVTGNLTRKNIAYSYVIKYYMMVKTGMETIHTPIIMYQEKYADKDIYNSVIQSAIDLLQQLSSEQRLAIYDSLHDGWSYIIDTNTVIENGSDLIKNDFIYYTVNKRLTGDIIVQNYTLTIPEDFDVTINGTVTTELRNHDRSNPRPKLKNDGVLRINSLNIGYYSSVENNGVLTVLNCVNAEDRVSVYDLDYCGVFNNGLFRVLGDLQFYLTNPYRVNYFHQKSSNAVLEVAGDVSFYNSSYCDITAGVVVLNGTQQQTLRYLKAYNLEANNPMGIKYDTRIDVYGRYTLNGNPVDSNGTYAYIHSGVSFDEISDYKELACDANTVLKCGFTGNLTVQNYTLTIPKDANITINGTVTTKLKNNNYSNPKLKNDGTLCVNNLDVSNYSSVENNGALTVLGCVSAANHSSDTATYCGVFNNGVFRVLGDLQLYLTNPYRVNYFHQKSSNAMLEVAGNISFYNSSYCDITAGMVVLNGTEQQTVKLLRSPTIVLENESEEGVVFTSSISPSILFNHSGNNFSLQAGGTFADYDNDGLKDNIDPHPTVHEHCLNGHSFGDWIIDFESTAISVSYRQRTCSICGNVETVEIPQIATLRFYGASLAMQNSLKVNFVVKKDLIDENGCKDLYTIFKMNGNRIAVTEYTTNDKYYIFTLSNIQRDQLNSEITAMLYTTYNNTLVSSASITSTVLDFGKQGCDINGDGSVDIRDLVRLKKMLCGIPLSEESNDAFDLNFNGKLDALDLTYLIKMLLLI